MKDETKKTTKDVFINLGAGTVGALASGLATGPLGRVNDIYTTQSSSDVVGNKYFNKKPAEIAKIIYNDGKEAARLKGKSPFIGGVKELYKGQMGKTFKNIPQNAINLAVFSALSHYLRQKVNTPKDK